MTYNKFKPLTFVYEYDFAVSGGAISTIPLICTPHVGNIMDTTLVIRNITVYVETPATSDGSATVTIGNSVDADGYFIDTFALIGGAAGTTFSSGKVAGALVWDDTNDVALNYKLPSVAGAIPNIVIGTAALTAGKFKVVFDCIAF